MLETVREFGLERLIDSGEEAEVRAAHAAYCLALAERTAPLVRGSEARTRLAVLEHDHGNLRAALAWFQARGEAEARSWLAAALGYFWSMSGHWTEGNAWLEHALAADPRPGSRGWRRWRTWARTPATRATSSGPSGCCGKGWPWPASWVPGRRSAACCMPSGRSG